jgi:hypothetical protein
LRTTVFGKGKGMGKGIFDRWGVQLESAADDGVLRGREMMSES